MWSLSHWTTREALCWVCRHNDTDTGVQPSWTASASSPFRLMAPLSLFFQPLLLHKLLLFRMELFLFHFNGHSLILDFRYGCSKGQNPQSFLALELPAYWGSQVYKRLTRRRQNESSTKCRTTGQPSVPGTVSAEALQRQSFSRVRLFATP